MSSTRCLAESVFRARGPRRSRRRGRKAGTRPGARSTGPGDAGPAPLGINLFVVAAPPARTRTRGDLGPGTRGEEGSSPGRGDENRTGWRLWRPPLSSGPPGGGRGRPGPGHAAAPRSLGHSAGCATGGAGAGVWTAGRAGRAWPPGLLHSAQGPAPPAAAPSPSAGPGTAQRPQPAWGATGSGSKEGAGNPAGKGPGAPSLGRGKALSPPAPQKCLLWSARAPGSRPRPSGPCPAEVIKTRKPGGGSRSALYCLSLAGRPGQGLRRG